MPYKESMSFENRTEGLIETDEQIRERIQRSKGYKHLLHTFVLYFSDAHKKDSSFNLTKLIEEVFSKNIDGFLDSKDQDMGRLLLEEDVKKLFGDNKKGESFLKMYSEELDKLLNKKNSELQEEVATIGGQAGLAQILAKSKNGEHIRQLARQSAFLALPRELAKTDVDFAAEIADLLGTPLFEEELFKDDAESLTIQAVHTAVGKVLVHDVVEHELVLSDELIRKYNLFLEELADSHRKDPNFVTQIDAVRKKFVECKGDLGKLLDFLTETYVPYAAKRIKVLVKNNGQMLQDELSYVKVDPVIHKRLSKQEIDLLELTPIEFVAILKRKVHEEIFAELATKKIKRFGFYLTQLGYDETYDATFAKKKYEEVRPVFVSEEVGESTEQTPLFEPLPEDGVLAAGVAQEIAIGLGAGHALAEPPIPVLEPEPLGSGKVAAIMEEQKQQPEPEPEPEQKLKNRREKRKAEKPYGDVISEASIPGVGEYMNVCVTVADEVISIPDRTLVLPKNDAYNGRRVEFRLSNNAAGALPPGQRLLSLLVVEKIIENGKLIAYLEIAPGSYKSGDMIQSLAYVATERAFILPDGSRCWIHVSDKNLVDADTGKLADGKMPIFRIGIEKKPGVYVGYVMNQEELDLQISLDHSFAQHGIRFTGSLGQQPFFHNSIPMVQREFLVKEIREATQEKPIDVVVSTPAGILDKGFKNFEEKLKEVLKDHAELADIPELLQGAKAVLDRFISGEADINWDPYVLFIRRIHDPAVSTAFKVADVRMKYFPSDLDGETAVRVMNVAGIGTTVIPFVPDNRREGEYVPGAWHVDINHRDAGLRELPDGTLGTFLDEGFLGSFSATKAVYNYLGSLGFLDKKFVGDTRLFEMFARFISEEDSFTGPYLSKEGAREVFNNYPYSIYGISKELIKKGEYEKVLRFFAEILPKLEEETKKQMIIENKLKGEGKPFDFEELEVRTLRKLVNLDVQDHFGSSFYVEVHNLIRLREKSVEVVKRLEERGFVGETRFGKTLFDVVSGVPMRSLAAFAAGYDCYVGFNPKNNTAAVSIASFAEQKLPDDFLTDETGQGGKVVKNGRCFVMNASSKRLFGFKQLADEIFIADAGGTKFEVPPGVQRFAEAQNPQDEYSAIVRFKWMRSPEQILKDYQNRFYKYQQILASATTPKEVAQKTRTDVISLYKEITNALSYKNLPSTVYNELLDDVRALIQEDFIRTYDGIRPVFVTTQFKKTIAGTNLQDSAEQLVMMVAEDFGLANYFSIMSDDVYGRVINFQKEELLKEWAKNN